MLSRDEQLEQPVWLDGGLSLTRLHRAGWYRAVRAGRRGLVATDHDAEASVGAPIYAVSAATTIGMIASCFRWLLVDHLHQWTGVASPVWDDSRLEARLSAFNYLVESHYRYYQFVANTLVAVVCAYVVNRWTGTFSFFGLGTDVPFLILCITLFAASRDALMKYYSRTGRAIGQITEKDPMVEIMYNGNDHGRTAITPAKPASEQKSGSEQKAQSPKPNTRTAKMGKKVK